MPETNARWRKYVRAHLPALAIRAERENEIIDELALQLEAAFDAAIQSGCDVDAATARATAEVPDWHALAREIKQIESRSVEPPLALAIQPHRADVNVMSGFLLDLRHSARSLRQSPGYTTVAVLTMALALGLGAAAFSLIDGILLRPLPYPAAERLVLIKATVPPEGRQTAEITLPDAQDLAVASDVFASGAAFFPYAATTTLTDPPSRLEGFQVSPTFFSTLGVNAAIGRTFTAADATPGREPVAMISDGLWQRLGSPRDIIGRPLTLNDVVHNVVGVTAPGFQVELILTAADVFVPLTTAHPFAANRSLRASRLFARLHEGVSIEQATAAVGTIGRRLETAYPATNRGRAFSVHPLQEEIVGPVRSQLWLVAALVTLVLLVAAINFAGLVLARSVGCLRELTVRLALGAGRWRLARESITEGLLVAALGATAGTAIAAGVLNLLRAAPGLALPRLPEVAIDQRSLVALGVVSLLIAWSAGLVPLLLRRHLAAAEVLHGGHETTSRPVMRLRSALIIGQTSFAFVLLATAALVATSLQTVLRQPVGFETAGVTTMRIAAPESRYATRDETVRLYTRLLDRLREHHAVQSAGFVSILPLAGNTGSTLTIQGHESTPLALRPTVGWHWASPGYFRAMGIPLIRGRDFTAEDLARAPHVTVINETLARQHFGGEDPIGKRVYFGGFGPGGPPEWHEVIGIVGDVRHRTLDAEPDARAYDLFGQHWGRTVSLAVRSAESPLQIASVVRQLVGESDPRLAVFAIRTTADLVSAAVAARKLLLWVVLTFASTGLAVSLIGLYGTVAYIVAQRTREMGVRLALGATTKQIGALVMRRGLILVASGLALGLAGTLVLRSVIETQLFGVTATNAPALAAAAAVLLFAAAVACLAPAARATRINPVDALRAE